MKVSITLRPLKSPWMKRELNIYFNASCFASPQLIGLGRYRNRVWEQRDGDRKWSRTS